MKKILISVLLCILPSSLFALAAFPGAQGMGASTVGGRGGTVYIVDTLSDTASDGSTFREACTASGARIIVFRVSGIIHLASDLTISNPYITIAGQTSPGGICIADHTFIVETHDVLVTHMRFRTGDLYKTGEYDVVDINGTSSATCGYCPGSPGTAPAYNVVFDHCSMAWSADEIFDLNYDVRSVTMSWCIFGPALYGVTGADGTSHNLGALAWGRYNSMEAPTYGASMHHCYFANNYYRNPEVNYVGFLDLVNNVAYNSSYNNSPHLEPDTDGTVKKCYANIIGCYQDVRGAESYTSCRSAFITSNGITPYQAVYMSGCQTSYLGASTPSWNVGDASSSYGADLISTSWQRSTPFSTSDIAVTATTMNSTYASYVVHHAGANRVQSTTELSYDDVDEEQLSEYDNNTGAYVSAASIDNVSDWGTYSTPTAPTDSDSDGMADAWETSTFGSTSATATGDADSDGYTNLEEYLFYLGGYESSGSTSTAASRGCVVRGARLR